jgi:hypothetical protein
MSPRLLNMSSRNLPSLSPFQPFFMLFAKGPAPLCEGMTHPNQANG